MATKRKRLMFTLAEIDAFDARQGYRRCSVKRITGETDPHPVSPFRGIRLVADLWRNREGRLVVRFSSNQPYVFHFEGFRINGDPVSEADVREFADYISEVLHDWAGADDPPNPEFSL